MSKDEMEELRTNALIEMAKKLHKLDKLDSLEGEMRSINQRLGAIEGTVNDTKEEVRVVKEDAAKMRDDIEDLKAKLANTEDVIEKNKTLEAELNKLKQDMEENFDSLHQITTYHQGMLESTDARFRATQILIYGVPEDDTLGSDDIERVTNVITKTNACRSNDLENIKVRRLGVYQNRPRPLHVTLQTNDQQRKILECAKNLANVTGYSRIYIRKDQHPTVRAEQNRIRKKEREEKSKPGMTNRIKYDHSRRVLLKDGRIIDRFSPSFRQTAVTGQPSNN